MPHSDIIGLNLKQQDRALGQIVIPGRAATQPLMGLVENWQR
jgi:hypothetical protein